ncbi:MAG: glycosyltransferase family 4 protein, partial [Actinobacteria bacterium]|nr:glycosyltransferase family 4 protein [Actinomycetota bacterium]
MSGGEIALMRLVEHLRERGLDNEVLCGGEGPLAAALRDRGVPVHVLPLPAALARRRRADLRMLATITPLPALVLHAARTARLARRVHADVIHTSSMRAHLYGLLAGKMARIPVVAHIRDDLSELGTGAGVAAVVRALLQRLPVAVVGCSAGVLEAAGIDKNRGTVVYSGVPSADVVQASGRALPDEPTDEEGPVVGMVARIAEWKGQHLFLDAAELVARQHPEVRFRIVGAPLFGEEEYLQRLQHQAEQGALGGRVEFTGFTSEPMAEYDRLTVAVASSVQPEPFGQVVVEAMARGRAVVAPAEGGPAEIITSGNDGVLVAPRDPAALAEGILDLLDDPERRRRLGANAAETVRARFTLEA